MQTKEKQIKQNGVSMIVLLITIVVMIILATISILTISNQDTITKAKEVKIKEDISTFKTDLILILMKRNLRLYQLDNIMMRKTMKDLKM